MKSRTIVLLTSMIMLGNHAWSTAFTKGNLVLSSNNKLLEYTLNGDLIQSVDIPSFDIFGEARDLVQGSDGRYHVYNGVFDPYLSTYNSSTGAWTHKTIDGWSTVNNISYGGIAVKDNHVFMTDMRTFGSVADQEQGIRMFDLTTQTFSLFATDIEPIDLTMGLDGYLYALYPGGSPGGREINVYNPDTLQLYRTIDLTSTLGWNEHRAIAVNESSQLFIADWDGDLTKTDANGNLLSTVNLNFTDPMFGFSSFDVDLDGEGNVAVGSRFGTVALTDENFSAINAISAGGDGVFVSFATIPEPTSLAMIGLVGGCAAAVRRRFVI